MCSIDYHPSEFLLLSGSKDRRARVWDLDSFTLLRSPPNASKPNPKEAAKKKTLFQPRRPCSASSSPCSTVTTEATPVSAVKFLPDGKSAVVCSDGFMKSCQVRPCNLPLVFRSCNVTVCWFCRHALRQWEPQPAVLEVHDAGWTCVADAAVNASNQLVAVTFSQQFCGIWAANLSSDKSPTVVHPLQSRGNDLSDSSSLKHNHNPSAASSAFPAAAAKHASAIAAATAKVHIEDRLPGTFQF